MKRSKKVVAMPLAVSAQEAWSVVGAVSGVEKWFSSLITSCRIEGDQRICGTADGEFAEDILNVDHDRMTFEYGIPTQHLLPVENIIGKMEVEPRGEGQSQITWTWTFDVDEANEQEVLNAFEGMGAMGIKGIEEYALKVAA